MLEFIGNLEALNYVLIQNSKAPEFKAESKGDGVQRQNARKHEFNLKM